MTELTLRLRVEQGYNRGQHYPLPEGTASIGRGEDCTIRLLAEGISRRHAVLVTDARGRVELKDQDSRNGVFVNGVRCAAAGLELGDRLQLGELVLRVVDGGELSQGPGSTLSLDLERAPSGSVHVLQAAAGGGWLAAPEVTFWGESEPVRSLQSQVERVARAGSALLVRGETGTGKELVARAVHALSARRRAPFVPVNCASLEGALLESELFGHERGAFTGAAARKMGLVETAGPGVLFLDEVGELPQAAQARLLRLLENGEFRRVGGVETLTARCQVVAATNRDLRQQVSAGRFREDLLYRLRVIELVVPPLRERGQDLALLIDRFFAHHCREVGRRLELSPAAREALLAWSWPGNVRELKNALERAVILAPGLAVLPGDLPPELTEGGAERSPMAGGQDGFPTLEQVEREHVERAMRVTEGARAQAAKLLGIDRKTLYRKLKSYGLAGDDGDA